MNKTLLSKTLAVSIILLLIGVSVSSAISIDNKPIISNNESVEDCGCKEVSDVDLVKVERLLNKVEVYSKLLLVLSRYNPELKGISEELVDEISKLKTLNDDFPIICGILESILINVDEMIEIYFKKATEAFNANNFLLSFLYYSLGEIYFFISCIIMVIGEFIFGCWEWP